MNQFKKNFCFTSQFSFLDQDNIDTDQIYPGRLLDETDPKKMINGFFADTRFNADRTLNANCYLNHPKHIDRRILVGGENFGCGSSREHAAIAIKGFGYDCVMAKSFGDIFYQNAIKNQVLPISISADLYQALSENLEKTIELRLDEKSFVFDGNCIGFYLSAFDQKTLLEGADHMDVLLSFLPKIASFREQEYK